MPEEDLDGDIFEAVRRYLPQYLLPREASDLYRELKKFPDKMNYYTFRSDLLQKVLQGDAWRGFVVIDYQTSVHTAVTGVVLSNSCDVDLDNPRGRPPSVVFAPMLNLDRTLNLLRDAGGWSQERVDEHAGKLRKQRITSEVYFPAVGELRESVVFLDDVHSLPASDFRDRSPEKIFTLSQAGFYLFLLKLSIHFSRFNEGISRG